MCLVHTSTLATSLSVKYLHNLASWDRKEPMILGALVPAECQALLSFILPAVTTQAPSFFVYNREAEATGVG